MFPIPFNFPFRKKDGTITTMDDAISSGGGYTLPTASAETKGGVKVGSGLSMNGETLNNNNPTPYSLPTASAETLGGVKIGSGISIDGNGVISASGGGGSSKHVHNIIINPTGSYSSSRIQCIIINDSSTPYTLETFNEYLRDNSYTYGETNPAYPSTGRYNNDPIYGVQGLTGTQASTSISLCSIAIVSNAHAKSVAQIAVALTDIVS